MARFSSVSKNTPSSGQSTVTLAASDLGSNQLNGALFCVARRGYNGDRATKAGFGGKVSENVTGAKDGQNAFDKWYKAAEHHRNMMRNGHAVVGVGQAGDKWCENFSSETE